MTIGNWNISDTKIEWQGGEENIFEIERSQLLETIKIDDESDEDLYKWIVIATTEEWLTVDDLYDLNFAFVYAAGASGSADFSYERFDKTVEYQFEMIDEEETEP
jgi:predicted membrane GTPase involved in stress response